MRDHLAARISSPVAAAPQLVGIGCSAGGPQALAAVLSKLPAEFPGAIVVVQHLDAQFAPEFVRWLGERSPLSVRTAREGDRPQRGVVLVAGTDKHLVFTGPNQLGYTAEPRDAIYRPSVDVFYHSLCRHWRGTAVGVLLTGMGRDGATGLKALRNAGLDTIAQDQATSAVYGMPKAAAEMNAAAHILPLLRIAPMLAQLVASPAIVSPRPA